MLKVSDGFKQAVGAPVRRCEAKVVFGMHDTTAAADARAAAAGEACISRLEQTHNQTDQMSAKLATCEPNYWRLDGSFVIPPRPGERPDMEVGWWSNALCSADGTFATPQTISFVFDEPHNSVGLTITFDNAANEYAADFDVKVYAGATLILSESVTGNKAVQYIVNTPIADYTKVELIIKKWAKGYRRARVAEVAFGLAQTYTGREIISLDTIEEMSTSVAAGEMKLVIDNQDKRFNILNPEGLYKYLQRRQKIQAFLGVETDAETEYVPAGVYYLSEWQSDEGGLVATFTARDAIDLLDQTTYRKGKLQTATLYELAEDVLEDAQIADYYLDPALQNISVTGYIPLVSHREALQMIAVAGRCMVRCDRQGKLIIKQYRVLTWGEVGTGIWAGLKTGTWVDLMGG